MQVVILTKITVKYYLGGCNLFLCAYKTDITAWFISAEEKFRKKIKTPIVYPSDPLIHQFIYCEILR